MHNRIVSMRETDWERMQQLKGGSNIGSAAMSNSTTLKL